MEAQKQRRSGVGRIDGRMPHRLTCRTDHRGPPPLGAPNSSLEAALRILLRLGLRRRLPPAEALGAGCQCPQNPAERAAER